MKNFEIANYSPVSEGYLNLAMAIYIISFTSVIYICMKFSTEAYLEIQLIGFVILWHLAFFTYSPWKRLILKMNKIIATIIKKRNLNDTDSGFVKNLNNEKTNKKEIHIETIKRKWYQNYKVDLCCFLWCFYNFTTAEERTRNEAYTISIYKFRFPQFNIQQYRKRLRCIVLLKIYERLSFESHAYESKVLNLMGRVWTYISLPCDLYNKVCKKMKIKHTQNRKTSRKVKFDTQLYHQKKVLFGFMGIQEKRENSFDSLINDITNDVYKSPSTLSTESTCTDSNVCYLKTNSKDMKTQGIPHRPENLVDLLQQHSAAKNDMIPNNKHLNKKNFKSSDTNFVTDDDDVIVYDENSNDFWNSYLFDLDKKHNYDDSYLALQNLLFNSSDLARNPHKKLKKKPSMTNKQQPPPPPLVDSDLLQKLCDSMLYNSLYKKLNQFHIKTKFSVIPDKFFEKMTTMNQEKRSVSIFMNVIVSYLHKNFNTTLKTMKFSLLGYLFLFLENQTNLHKVFSENPVLMSIFQNMNAIKAPLIIRDCNHHLLMCLNKFTSDVINAFTFWINIAQLNHLSNTQHENMQILKYATFNSCDCQSNPSLFDMELMPYIMATTKFLSDVLLITFFFVQEIKNVNINLAFNYVDKCFHILSSMHKLIFKQHYLIRCPIQLFSHTIQILLLSGSRLGLNHIETAMFKCKTCTFKYIVHPILSVLKYSVLSQEIIELFNKILFMNIDLIDSDLISCFTLCKLANCKNKDMTLNLIQCLNNLSTSDPIILDHLKHLINSFPKNINSTYYFKTLHFNKEHSKFEATNIMLGIRLAIKKNNIDLAYLLFAYANVNKLLTKHSLIAILDNFIEETPSSAVLYVLGHMSGNPLQTNYVINLSISTAVYYQKFTLAGSIVEGFITSKFRLADNRLFKLSPLNVHYLSLVGLFSKEKMLVNHLHVLDNFISENISPYNIYIILDELLRLRNTTRVKLILRKFEENRFEPSIHCYGSLMRGYDFVNELNNAMKLWVTIMQKKIIPTHYLFASIFNILVKSGLTKYATQIFMHSNEANYTFGSIHCSILLKGCSNEKLLDEAICVYNIMEMYNIKCNNVLYNSLLHLCVWHNNINLAVAIFNNMKQKNVLLDHITYSILIRGYCNMSYLHEAQKLFDEMTLLNHIKPDHVIFNIILHGYSKLGMVKEATDLFNLMLSKNISPTPFTITILVKMFGKANNIYYIEYLIDNVVKRFNIKLDTYVYTTLIVAYLINKNIAKALYYFYQLRDIVSYKQLSSRTCETILLGCIQNNYLLTAYKLLIDIAKTNIYINKKYPTLLISKLQSNAYTVYEFKIPSHILITYIPKMITALKFYPCNEFFCNLPNIMRD